MTAPTPLHPLFDHAEARWERYGPPPGGAGQVAQVDVAALFDFVDIEYAAIRKGCGLLDQPHRGTLVFTGADRLAFLNRMVTQELKNAAPFTAHRAFWLNRKGRIDADLRLIVLEDRIVADVDLFAADRARQTLGAYIISDDVAVTDASQSHHRLALHGPGARQLLSSFGSHVAGFPVPDLGPGQVSILDVAGHRVIVDRWDSTGDAGLELTLAADAVVPVFQTLLQAAHQNAEGHTGVNPRPRLRPIGWHAYNVARIEAGTPLYMLDFGPDALPAETGVLHDRVSFKKGCYLGQEIVARMHALGQPKQTVVGLKFEEPQAGAEVDASPPLLPAAGAPVFLDPIPADGKTAEPVGSIASGTSSPMLGGTPIAFAMVRQKHSAPGTRLLVPCVDHPDAQPLMRPATVQPGLAFWSRG
ncbi:MAG TPA: glycine cleavage T C-terminal barrel domain-containing protein [Phycisphaerales bacterium]|nr:glycine cleavage T C-terminal barrel domain-containing protein [Phycisphaerales bacterium]